MAVTILQLSAINDYECAPDRCAVAVAVNGVPIFGPEEGPVETP